MHNILVTVAFAQDSQQLLRKSALQMYTGVDPDSNLIAGFSVPALIGALLFSAVGFVAFVYGKKNEELKPLLFGLALMIYPYFFKGTLALYAVGCGLIAGLYFFRD